MRENVGSQRCRSTEVLLYLAIALPRPEHWSTSNTTNTTNPCNMYALSEQVYTHNTMWFRYSGEYSGLFMVTALKWGHSTVNLSTKDTAWDLNTFPPYSSITFWTCKSGHPPYKGHKQLNLHRSQSVQYLGSLCMDVHSEIQSHLIYPTLVLPKTSFIQQWCFWKPHLSNTGASENLIYPTLVLLKTSFIQHWCFRKPHLSNSGASENLIYPTVVLLKTSFIQHWCFWKPHLSDIGASENLIYPTLVLPKTSFIQQWCFRKPHLSNSGASENLIYPTLVLLKTSFIRHWCFWKPHLSNIGAAENLFYPTLVFLKTHLSHTGVSENSFIPHWCFWKLIIPHWCFWKPHLSVPLL